jgi:hypothetical protein
MKMGEVEVERVEKMVIKTVIEKMEEAKMMK